MEEIMKRPHALILIIMAALALLAVCSQDSDDSFDGIQISLPIDGSGGRHYCALSTGEEVTPAWDNWDIAFEAHNNCFFILTNSGDTALDLGAAGGGGVWFTDSTDFGAVNSVSQRVIPPSGGEYEPYTEDAVRWAMVMGAEPVKQFLNVITYLGYPGSDDPLHDGASQATYFQRKDPAAGAMASFVPYLFNKRQAFTMHGMPPDYAPTRQVYVIRHGDGAAYSKLQLSEVYLEPGDAYRFILRVRHEIIQ
jgi:hypothetical protein